MVCLNPVETQIEKRQTTTKQTKKKKHNSSKGTGHHALMMDRPTVQREATGGGDISL